MRNLSFVCLFLFLLLAGGTAISAEVDTGPPEIKELLPQDENYLWVYSGFAEYGHEMEIISIGKTGEETRYSIEGEVFDPSGGVSDSDFSLSLTYTATPEVLMQTTEEEMMMDSDFDQLELIRIPLEKGNSWTQDVTDEDGKEITLESEITNVEMDEGHHVYTVRYQDVASPYFEERRIKENVGVVEFKKLMIDEEGNYEMTYSLFEEASGVQTERNFTDTFREDWYMRYVPSLVSLDIIHGYPDGTFRSGDKVTVAEFLKMMLHSISYKADNGMDVWYSPYVETAIDLDIIDEGEFEDYNRPITREEMVKIMILAIEYDPSHSGDLPFKDKRTIDKAYRGYVQAAAELGIVAGYPDNTFRPETSTSRGEAAKLLYYTVLLLEQKEFTSSDALALEEEFDARLFPETDGQKVLAFDTKAELTDHLAEVVERGMAEILVDSFYTEEADGLYVVATEKPAMLFTDKPYQLYMDNQHTFYMVQEAETELYGPYRLVITYEFFESDWIITDRSFTNPAE